ncbi:hypothetical protein D1872_292330 [compost metagenome]
MIKDYYVIVCLSQNLIYKRFNKPRLTSTSSTHNTYMIRNPPWIEGDLNTTILMNTNNKPPAKLKA